MSFSKNYREAWCKQTVREAVAFWHKQRVKPENAHADIAKLATDCAWFVFHRRGKTIVGDVQAYAKRFAGVAYDRFQEECRKVLTKPEETEELVA